MKINHSIFYILLVKVVLICMITACEDSFETRRVEPKIDVQDTVYASQESMRMVIPLTSTYPWFAEASNDWMTLTRYRGQALKPDSIILTFEENNEMDIREGWIEVRLMDQLSQKINITQQGRGSLITLPQSLVFFNKEGGEVLLEVITHQNWEPEVSSKNGFSFSKVDSNHLKINASLNNTNEDKVTEIKLVDKDRTTEATLTIIQKPVDKILFIPLEKEKRDIIIKRAEYAMNIPVTLNVQYECVPSVPWIKVTSATQPEGLNVQNIIVSMEVETNDTGVERDGYLEIKNKGESVEASDTIFVSQRGKSQIIYVKPGGNSDGTSWEHAFGSIHDAMDASSNNGDLEIWVAKGEYQFPSTLTWKHVNVYGGFSGIETKFKERDLKNKPIFKGGKFNIMNAWDNNSAIAWMDGIIFSDCDNYDNTGVGCFEIYKNHGFRNCEFRNIRHGNAIAYMNNCVVENCVFTNLQSKRYLLRGDNTQYYNVTVTNCIAADWNSNYIYGNSKIYNSIFWNIQILNGERFRALTIGGNVIAINCAIQSGITESGLLPTNCIELGVDNNAFNGPNFVNPIGETPDHTLKMGSICIDSGNSEYARSVYDFLGNKRIYGSSIDIGAYEYFEN